MTSKEEIKVLLINEMKSTSMYQEVLLLKDYIINKINEPSIVNMTLHYNFSTELSDNDKEIFQICFLIEFGWIEQNLNNTNIVIDLTKFII